MAFPLHLSYDMTLEPNSASAYYVPPQPVVGTTMTASVGTNCPASVTQTDNGQIHHHKKINADPLVAKDCYEDMFQEIAKKLYTDGVTFQPVSEQQLGLLLQNQQNSTQSELGLVNLNNKQVSKDDNYPSESSTSRPLLKLPVVVKATHTTSTSNLTTTPAKKPNAFELKQPIEALTWVESEEFLLWHTPTKVASYNATLRKFRCLDCGCVGLISQIVEHWIGKHSNMRVFKCPWCDYHSAWASCIRSHLTAQHFQLNPHGNSRFRWRENPVMENVTSYLLRLKNSVPIGIVKSDKGNQYPVGASHGHTDLLQEKTFKCCICNKPLNRSDPNQKHFCDLHREMVNKFQKTTANQDHMNQLQSTTAPTPSQVPLYTYLAVQEHHTLPLVNETAAHPPSSGVVEKGKEKLYSCNYCTWRGIDNWSLKRHYAAHNKPFRCPFCNHSNGRKYRLVNHIRKQHRKWLCSKCFFVADGQDSFSQHMQELHFAY